MRYDEFAEYTFQFHASAGVRTRRVGITRDTKGYHDLLDKVDLAVEWALTNHRRVYMYGPGIRKSECTYHLREEIERRFIPWSACYECGAGKDETSIALRDCHDGSREMLCSTCWNAHYRF